jgi:acyl-coenzyme A thioesterase PaaI-like protein
MCLDMKELPHTHYCFVCGEANRKGLNLRFQTDGQVVSTRFVPQPEHVGFKHAMHGGLVATLLDEMMVWVCAVRTKRFAYCAELTVRFVNPVPPNQPTVAVAELVADHRGRLFEAKAELRDERRMLLASASGKYLPVGVQEAEAMTGDMLGDSEAVLAPKTSGA